MLQYLLRGGPLMWGLLGLSILGLAVVFDRWRIFKVAAVETAPLRARILEFMGDGKLGEAIDLCAQTKGPVAAILMVGLNRYRRLLGAGKDEATIDVSVSQSMEDYAPHVINAMEKRINLLLLVGSIAPLVGMTGTVTGMIKAFSAMAEAGLGGEVVAAGISEALITTAAGLLLAVPAVVFYNIFSNKVEQYTLTIEESASELVEFIHLQGS